MISQAQPTIQTTFASAAAFADATHGNAAEFRRFMTPYVGSMQAQQFVSMSLWRAHAPDAPPVTVIGPPPSLRPGTAAALALFGRSTTTAQLSVIGLRHGGVLSALGYAFETPRTGRYLVYGERPLPADRRSRFRKNQAFSELNYAFYLGRSQNANNLQASGGRPRPWSFVFSEAETTRSSPFMSALRAAASSGACAAATRRHSSVTPDSVPRSVRTGSTCPPSRLSSCAAA